MSMNLIFLIYKVKHKTCKSYYPNGLEEDDKTVCYENLKIYAAVYIFIASQPHILG